MTNLHQECRAGVATCPRLYKRLVRRHLPRRPSPPKTPELPLQIILKIADFCEELCDVAAFAVTCRDVYEYLDRDLYRRDFLDTKPYDDETRATMWASEGPNRLETLRKWVTYTDGQPETSGLQAGYLAAALEAAVRHGNNHAAEYLLGTGAPTSYFNSTHRSIPLSAAIKRRDPDMALRLIQAGCARDDASLFMSPMELACVWGDESAEIVRKMLEMRSHPHLSNCPRTRQVVYRNAPEKAARNGSLELMQLFIDFGTDLRFEELYPFPTLPIYLATVNNDYNMLKLLLDNDGCPDWHSEHGQQLLPAICAYATPSTMSLFIDSDRLSTHTVLPGLGPLLSCSLLSHSSPELHRYLIEQSIKKGADINRGNELAYAIRRSQYGETYFFDQLIEAGVDVNKHFSTIGAAIEHPSTRFLQRLIAAGADLSIRGPEGKTPLMMASSSKDKEEFVIEILNKFPGTLNAKDDKGRTALRHARKRRAEKTIEVLQARGAEL